jgi:uncharacterized membrane protein YcaP (DUF421 family)
MMWDHFLIPDLPILNLVFRAGIVYLSVLILLRISGKRQMGQLGATEFVAILLISNAVQNSMNGGDNSVTGGLVLATVLIALSSLISYLTYRSRAFSRIFEGTPTLLVHNGKVIQEHLRKELLSESELKVMLRKQGIHHFTNIENAVLESDGTLSVHGYQGKTLTD